MKAPSERGVTGAWAYQARQELGLSVEQVAAAMETRGQAVSAATIRGIESGSKKPGARLLRVLAQVLESVPPGPVAPPADDPIVEALREQSEWMRRYVEQTDRRIALLEQLLAAITGQPQLPAAVRDEAAAFAAEARRASPLQSSDPAPATE